MLPAPFSRFCAIRSEMNGKERKFRNGGRFRTIRIRTKAAADA
jgi:hypothetical protein